MSNRKTALPNEFLDQMAHRFKLLGDPMRLRLLQALMAGEQTVSALAEQCGSTPANLSRHLQILRLHQIVRGRKDGQHVYYQITDPTIPELCAFVCERLAQQAFPRKAALDLRSAFQRKP